MDVRRVVLPGLLMSAMACAWSAPLELKRVSVGNTDFTYVEAGRGDAVVFVHGELQDYRVWEKQLDFFSRDYRAIAYSRRNHFPNRVALDGIGDSAVETHAADLAAFVSNLGLDSTHVVAHSSGAHTALFFAAAYPKMARSLVLHEPTAVGVLRDSPIGLTLYRPFEAKLARARDAFRSGQMLAGAQLFNDTVYGSGSFEELDDNMQSIMLANAFAQASDAAAKTPPMLFSCAMARQITAPTLVTTGKNSLPLFQRIADELKECMPNNEQAVLSGAHDVPMDNPRAFNKAAQSFLEERRR
jgi:non-heme chloroperoxidase